MDTIQPVFIVGCMRSGKTTLRRALQRVVELSAASSSAGAAGWNERGFAELSGDDGEGRTFWQAFGLAIGARRTGTFCLHADKSDVKPEHRLEIQAHVENMCAGGHRLISDNAHLLNKIGFVAEALAQSKFIFVMRKLESVVAEWKYLFQKANTSNEDYPAFVHYWPECEFPCWYVVRNDLLRTGVSAASLRRWAVRAARVVGLKRAGLRSGPSCAFRHEKLSSFLGKHSDLSRYYPGEGFSRLPEAWIRMNHDALLQLLQIKQNRWITICFEELIDHPGDTLRKTLDFLGWELPASTSDLSVLEFDKANSREHLLTEREKAFIEEAVKAHFGLLEVICRQCGPVCGVES